MLKERIDLALGCIPPSPFRDQLAKLFSDMTREADRWRKNGTEDCDGCLDRDTELEDLRRQRDELKTIIDKARPEYIRLTNNHVGTWDNGSCIYEADSKIMAALDSVFESRHGWRKGE